MHYVYRSLDVHYVLRLYGIDEHVWLMNLCVLPIYIQLLLLLEKYKSIYVAIFVKCRELEENRKKEVMEPLCRLLADGKGLCRLQSGTRGA